MTATLETIEASAFIYCQNLKTLELPAGSKLSFLGDSAFEGTGLTGDLVLPDSVEVLSNACFRNCTGLTSLTLPASLESVGSWLLEGCTALKKVVYNGTAEAWEALEVQRIGNEILFSDLLVFAR